MSTDDPDFNEKFQHLMSSIFSDEDERDEEIKTYLSQFSSVDEANVEYQYKDFSDTDYARLSMTHRDFVKLIFFF